MAVERKGVDTKPMMTTNNQNASSGFPVQNLNLKVSSKPKKFRHIVNDDKKVEVRWLDTDSNSYLKHWQRRYRQIEGVERGFPSQKWSKDYLKHYDDWCFTARNILDIDVQYMSSKDYNKFNPKVDILFKEEDYSFGMDDNSEEDFELDEDLEPCLTIENNQELIAALKSNNIVIKNGKLEYCFKKGKNAEKDKSSSERQSKKTPKLVAPIVTADTSNSTTDESTSSFLSTDTSPGKCNHMIKSPRKSPNMTKMTRPRPNSNRRQMYVCEYPGCVYQSDRNFNFLRHKRTHGKQKGTDDEHSPKKLCEVATTTSELIYAASKAHTLNDDSCVGLDLNSLNNDYLHLNVDPSLLPSNELNLNMVQCNSINIVNNDQPFSLSTDDYMDRQNFIIKDINTLDHHSLSDNRFSSLSLEPAF